jgi:hypothetical protein
MNTAKKITSENTDQLVSQRMVNATLQELIMDAEKLILGNGPISMTHSTHMLQEFYHQLIEGPLTLVMLRKSSFGLILEILDKLLLLRSMVQTNK